MFTRDDQNFMVPATGISGTIQVVSASSSSAATTNALADSTKFVRIATTEDVHWTQGAAPTATTSHEVIPKGVEVRWVKPGVKLAFIRVSVDGTVSVSEFK